MNILQINSSIRGELAQSSQLAQRIVSRLQSHNPNSQLKLRDLAAHPHPMLDASVVHALATDAEQRSPQQAALVAANDTLITELQACDVLVLAVPMYNFAIPAQLKNWIDAICRARVTFRYTEQGPQGLVIGKTVYVALARGGFHRDTTQDSQVSYLTTVLAFLGMTDVHFIYAEGLSRGEQAVQQAFAQAQAEINRLIH